jgi:hypothetical protein
VWLISRLPIYNKNTFAGLLTGDYVEFYLPKEINTLGVACYGGWSSSWKVRKYDITVQTPSEIFFLLSPSVTEEDQCVDMGPIDKNEFLILKEGSNEVNVGEVSTR